MTIESGINISQAYLDEYRHTTRVHSKLRDYLTNILNGTLHIDIFKSTQPKKKTLRKGTTIQKSVQTSSASILPSTVPLKNFTILFTIGCLGFKQKKVFNYILKRDLHEVEAAFLLFHTISLGTWGHVNEEDPNPGAYQK
ncbi:hypothetical protein AX774_g2308 [Zancudomyces culisetae]|uniref:Uncharacterized protein n=1 Tax=Zancudomyces culisetae TaxID=1213189 RepID=A0A1R1PT43_ZANCU|nr:hypothetical protein AX774_g2308 [Zancudomyces culisetae]|eukprot:OMH84165.1 hypothetical protein AX774_g2308 [Zancudomyces culisetae]